METRRLLATLRRGETPSREAISAFANGLAQGRVSSAQAAAFAMAVCIRGLDEAGRVALTLAMRDSGDRLIWDLPGPVLDKHSTGGIGDCVSLILAPALAACGAFVPMISGRGLGHTGGTLDKLEAIPGLTVDLDEARFRQVVSQTGCAIVGASADIAPADRILYAIRDVTSTVDSIDLIIASILSKKLAAGLEGLVLDVKAGSGAFMKTSTEAEALAAALVATANAAGCPTRAVLTDMNQPLAPSLGNALEVAEVMRVLTGGGRGALAELSYLLGGLLAADAGLVEGPDQGAAQMAAAVSSGAAAERFGAMVAAMGGPADFVETWASHLPSAPVTGEVAASAGPGFVSAIDGEALGMAVVVLGGGRRVETDRVNPAVGLTDVVRLGAAVEPGQSLARIHAASEPALARAVEAVSAAIRISDAAPAALPLIGKIIA